MFFIPSSPMNECYNGNNTENTERRAMPIIILAHGGLGIFDEVIFISIAVVFIGMMAFSWFRSQQLDDEFYDDDSNPMDSRLQSSADDIERFELE